MRDLIDNRAGALYLTSFFFGHRTFTPGHVILPGFTCGQVIFPECPPSVDLSAQNRLQCGHFMLPAPAILWVKLHQYPAACGGRRGSGLAPRLIPFILSSPSRNSTPTTSPKSLHRTNHSRTRILSSSIIQSFFEFEFHSYAATAITLSRANSAA